MSENYHSRFDNFASTLAFNLSLFDMDFSRLVFKILISEFLKSSSNRLLIDRIFSSKANLIFRYTSTALWLDSNSYSNNILNSFVSQKIVKLYNN